MEMVQISTDSFNSMCRTCLAAADTTVFQIVFEDIQLVEMFEKCTTIQMNENDHLPHNICKNCIDEMLRFYKFRTKCLETQAVLTKVIADEEDRKQNTVLEIKQPEIDIWDVHNGLESGIEQSADVESVNQSTSNPVSTNAQLCARANRLTEIVCYVCNIRFESRQALLKHRAQRGHPKGVRTCVPCPICSESCLITCLKSHVLKKHPHKCDVCFKHYNLPGHLEKHRTVQMNEQKFLCDVCGMAFRRQLASYVLAQKIVVWHACRYCEQQFTGEDELKRHELGECPKRLPVVVASLPKTAQLGCGYCEAVFSSQSDLNEHIQLHKMEVETNSDDEIMIVQVIDENHLDLERGSDDNISKKADRKLNTGLEIIKQEVIEIFDDPDDCLESGIEQSSEKLSTRANVSTESICSVSNIGFESHQALAFYSGEAGNIKDDGGKDLWRHKLHDDPKKLVEVACKVIEVEKQEVGEVPTIFEVIDKNNLDFDLGNGNDISKDEDCMLNIIKQEEIEIFDVHDNHLESGVVCRECKQQFNDLRDFRKHKLRNCPKKLAVVGSNSKRTTTVCYVCNKNFDTHEELVWHRNEPGHPTIRTAIVPCPICSQLTRAYRMKFHLLKHSTEKSCVCDVCGKAFKDPGNLRRHAKIHTVDGEKPFQCDLCGAGFTQAQSKKLHMLTIHQNTCKRL